MKRYLALLLATMMMVMLCACGAGSTKANSSDDSTAYASQEEFLKDMAKGISTRLSNLDDNKERTDEEKSEYYQKLVGYELDKIEKYENAVFEDETFNELAHEYIDGCQMQRFAAQNYRNETLYNLWSAGATARNIIIMEMYSHYNLPISSEEAEYYSATSTTVTITTQSSGNQTGSSKAETEKEAIAIESMNVTGPDKDGWCHVDFTIKNVLDEMVHNITLSVTFIDKDGNIINATFPGQSARLATDKTEVIEALLNVNDDPDAIQVYIDNISYQDSNDIAHVYYVNDPIIYNIF